MDKIEEWRSLEDFPGYEFSSFGRVRGPKGKILKPLDNGSGYKEFSYLRKYKPYIHRCVAKAFIPNPYGWPDINHKDGDRGNNAVENLEWCTASYNISYSYQHLGRTDPRQKSIRCVETGEIFLSIRAAGRAKKTTATNIRQSIARGWKCANLTWEYIHG